MPAAGVLPRFVQAQKLLKLSIGDAIVDSSIVISIECWHLSWFQDFYGETEHFGLTNGQTDFYMGVLS